MQDYKLANINRLSVGLQTTNNDILKLLGRIHTYNDFLNTYQMALEAGFENINVDLMIGLPNQTIEDVKDSLQKIINLEQGRKPQHISVYSLIIEPNTKIENIIEEGKVLMPSDEEERQQYHYVRKLLKNNGYEHYEISNFAIKNRRAKHNINCWEQKEYIGFGVAAHSYINNKRFSNTVDLKEYLCKNYKEIKTVHEIQTR